MDAIPKEVALQLGNEIRAENSGKRFSFAWFQCWGCTKFSKGNPDKMCLGSKEGYRGCNLVNNRYDRMKSQ